MDKTFQLNPSLSNLDLKDAIYERNIKIAALLNCLVATHDATIEIDRETIYNTVWIVHDFFEEIQLMEKHLRN